MLLVSNVEHAEDLVNAMPEEHPCGDNAELAKRFIERVEIDWVRRGGLAERAHWPHWRLLLGAWLPFLVPRARYRITLHDKQ